MAKYIFSLILCLFLFRAADAQKDTSVYYLQNTGKVVSTKDSADFFLVILPPDTSVDKKLFVVKEYYKNGKIRLTGNSKTNNLNLKFQGPQITFFQNGHRMRIKNFKDDHPLGDEIEYYPNGKFYAMRNYDTGSERLISSNDSIGNVIADKGKGKWVEYSEDFKDMYAEGPINNGVQDGLWKGRINDSVGFEKVFGNGRLISSETIYKYKPTREIFDKFDVAPEFTGGLEVFYRFLGGTARYPAAARKNGTQGRVIVKFMVEKDGTLSNIKVIRGVGDGIDEEVVRIMKLSPPWKPGSLNGNFVRVTFSMPISFTLEK